MVDARTGTRPTGAVTRSTNAHARLGAIECPQCGQLQKPAKQCRNKECKTDIEKVSSPSAGLRFPDLRHHAITELAESQTSEQTMSIAGHVSPRMLAHYSHVRLQAKRCALDALCGAGTRSSIPEPVSANSVDKRGLMSQITSQKGAHSEMCLRNC